MTKTITGTLVALSLVVATGCGSARQHSSSSQAPAASTSSSQAPAASTSTSSTSSSATSAAVDYRTVDPCSLVSPHSLDSLAGQVIRTVSETGYGTCQVDVRAKGRAGARKQWSVALSMTSSFVSPVQQLSQVYHTHIGKVTEHGTPVYQGGSGSSCIRAFNLPDGGPTLVISALSMVKPCQAADAALASSLATTASRKVKQLPLPGNSLARVDFCASFTAAAASYLGGSPKPLPTGAHGCQWSVGAKSLLVSLQSTSWPPSNLTHARRERVGSRQAIVSVISGHNETLAQGAVEFGAAPIGPTGSIDSISVLSAVRAAANSQSPQELRQFLAALARAPGR